MTALRKALTTPAALVYLALCAALTIWAVVVTATDTTDESMAGVIPLLATAPLSLVFLALPDGTPMLILALALGALTNATFIGWCARTLRRDNDSR
ncbi:hypothetical protein ABZ896_02875 [Streptomyces sp. NPDC047072]|uniref:SCO4225 family membrane protein n=1 Tax=Streptomyces sp. NPDC047072 TaxID=3154809 RepID=UPI0033DB2EBC